MTEEIRDSENYPETISLTFLEGVDWPLPIRAVFSPKCDKGVRGGEFSLTDSDLIRFRSAPRVVYTSRAPYIRVMHESLGIFGNQMYPRENRIPQHLEYLNHIVGNYPVPVIELWYERKDGFQRDEPDRPRILR